MKAQDLMIGDWLKCSDPTPFRITDIETEKGTSYFRVTGDDGWVVDGGELEPIPLTGEILEKNGFRHRRSEVWGDFYTYTYTIKQNDKVLEYEQHFNLSPDPYEGDGFHWIPAMSALSALRVVCVHELQQLLRLCKIEKEIEL